MKTIEEYLNDAKGRSYSFVDNDDLLAWQEDLNQLRAAWRKIAVASAVSNFTPIPADSSPKVHW